MRKLEDQHLELHDVQGMVIRGYGEQPDAHYIFLEITDPAKAKKWLAAHADAITTAEKSAQNHVDCMNLAFTRPGLVALGMDEANIGTFDGGVADVEGMTTVHRSRILGDHGTSAPTAWEWGHNYKVVSNGGTIHLMLMIFAQNKNELNALHQRYTDTFADGGLKEIHTLEGLKLHGRKEHFGFRDGISQPYVNGSGKEPDKFDDNTVMAGEMILGYKNDYNKFPDSPYLVKGKEQGHYAGLPFHPVYTDCRDIGKNGTYLVFRQLEQNVKEFWDFMQKNSPEVIEETKEKPYVFTASKMVGRWPSGAPLVKCPFHDDPKLQNDDNFNYSNDKNFEKCPLGSHLRRTNPRDTFIDNPKKSISIVNKHRIIRRGRPYGQPISPTLDPDEVLQSDAKDGGRGLQFICINANIDNQFEFVQQTWINDQKFRGLYNDPDPIMGDPDAMQNGNKGQFTDQHSPLRRKIKDIPRFVNVKGGAYFFLPSVTTIRFLSTL